MSQRKASPVLGALVGAILALFTPTRLPASTWTEAVRLTYDPYPSDDPAVAAFSPDEVVVVWADYGGLDAEPAIRARHWNGFEWTPKLSIAAPGGDKYEPSVVRGLDGRLHLVWEDNREGVSEIYYARWDEGVWSEQARLSAEGASSKYPGIAADSLGNVHVVWYDDRDGNREIYYRRWDGSAWSEPERLTVDNGESRGVAIAAGADGSVHVVWYDDRDGNEEVYYKRFDGASWSEDERVSWDVGQSRDPVIAIGRTGVVHVVWRDRRDGDWELYASHRTGALWSLVPERLTEAAGAARRPTIVTDQTGVAHLVWREGREGHAEIYYRSWNAGEWGAEERLTYTTYTNAYPTMSTDPQGNLHLAWSCSPQIDYEVCYSMRPASCAFGAPPIDAESDGTVSIDCAPNPFRQSVTFSIRIGSPTTTALEIFDTSGRRVRALAIDGGEVDAQTVDWDGNDNEGEPLATGTYYYRIATASRKLSGKLMLLR